MPGIQQLTNKQIGNLSQAEATKYAYNMAGSYGDIRIAQFILAAWQAAQADRLEQERLEDKATKEEEREYFRRQQEKATDPLRIIGMGAAGSLLGAGMGELGKMGAEKAFSAIFDSNLTTIMAALILLHFDSGPIKGFALTFGLGVLLSMLTAITATRLFLKSVAGKEHRGAMKFLFGVGIK